MSLVLALLGALRAALKTRTDLTLENLALRQQLALLRRRSKRPKFGLLDRAFWMWLSQWWTRWSEVLRVVSPQTVIRWHRQSLRAFWTWKSRLGRVGRPRVGGELADLVRTIAWNGPPIISGRVDVLPAIVSAQAGSRDVVKDGFVVVISFWRIPEAGMAASLLRNEGIEVELTDAGLAGVNPFLSPVIGGVRLLVPERDAERARVLLRELGLDGGSAAADLESASLEQEAMSSPAADESVGDFLKRK